MMSNNFVRNPRELKDLILRRLGAPVIQVEVTEDHIYDSIGRALELYKEYHHDGLNKAYLSVKLNQEQAATGYIDISAYPVFAITKIIRHKSMMWGGLGGGATLNFFTDFLTTLGGGPQGISYHGPFGALGNIGFFAQFQSYQNMMMDQLDPLPDYWLDPVNGVVQLTGNFRENDVIIMEVHIQNFVELEKSVRGVAGAGIVAGGPTSADNKDKWMNPYSRMPSNVAGRARSEFPDQGVYNVRWVKDYATTLTKEVWGEILAKHQGMSLPGGVTVDGTRLVEEARQEKEVLRQELLLLEEPLPILMG
ncbi:gp13 neck protein [Aeromonas phage Aeh1]|uniref:Gp13 neck protein n=1 Tax=Aeromonas phage Aeh1 TaxID=2880362 RepID=Q858C2_9CAUD|nr:head-tail adaptor Ad2 [Aeromonas phage Aeh1]AAP04362.2 gp13 neck protein [Aeromonas phage Aeh1]